MTTTPKPPRPPLASAHRGRIGPFGALIAAASQDPAAARGLASAYASLDVVARLRIVDAVVIDARAEGIAPGAALLPLLAVEEDTAVAQVIAAALRAEEGGIAPITGADVTAHALVAGDATRGAVLLTRPLYGEFVEVLGLAWREEEGLTHTLFEPLTHRDKASGCARRLPPDLTLEAMPIDYAVDLLAPVLWRARRRGHPSPVGIERFADLFSLPAVIED